MLWDRRFKLYRRASTSKLSNLWERCLPIYARIEDNDDKVNEVYKL